MLSLMVPGMIQEVCGEKETRPLCLIRPCVGTSSPRIIISRELWRDKPQRLKDVPRHQLRTQLKPTHLAGTGGPGHRQHLALLQVEADVLQDRRDVQVGEEEAGVAVQLPAGLALLLNLLKQLTDALRKRVVYSLVNPEDARTVYTRGWGIVLCNGPRDGPEACRREFYRAVLMCRQSLV